MTNPGPYNNGNLFFVSASVLESRHFNTSRLFSFLVAIRTFGFSIPTGEMITQYRRVDTHRISITCFPPLIQGYRWIHGEKKTCTTHTKHKAQSTQSTKSTKSTHTHKAHTRKSSTHTQNKQNCCCCCCARRYQRKQQYPFYHHTHNKQANKTAAAVREGISASSSIRFTIKMKIK